MKYNKKDQNTCTEPYEYIQKIVRMKINKSKLHNKKDKKSDSLKNSSTAFLL